MFDLEIEIEKWRAELGRAGIRDREVVDELEAHLREHIARLKQSEPSDAEIFRMAVARMGDARILKQEFGKVWWRRLLGCRNTPAGLKILAFWFILMGLNSLLLVPFLIRFGFVTPPTPFHSVPLITFISLLGLNLCYAMQLPIGLGLLHRKNLWRKTALGWTALFLILCLYSLVLSRYDSRAPFQYGICSITTTSVKGSCWMLLGIRLPIEVMHIFGLANLAMLIWGLYLLTTPPVKNLFRRAT